MTIIAPLLMSLAAVSAPARVLPVDPPAPELRAELLRALSGRLDPEGNPLTPEEAGAPSCPRDDIECLQQAAGAVGGDEVRWVLAPATFTVGDQRYLEIVAVSNAGDAGTSIVPLGKDAPARALDAMFPRLSPGPYAILVDGPIDNKRRAALEAALGDALAGMPRIDPAQVKAAARTVKAQGCEGDCLARIGLACGARHVVRALASPGAARELAVSIEVVRVADDAEVARTMRTWREGPLGPVVDPGPQTRVMVSAGEATGLVRVDGRLAARLPQVAPIAGVKPGDHEISVAQGERAWRTVVPIAPGRLIEVASPNAPGVRGPTRTAPQAVEVALGPSEVLGRPRVLVAAVGSTGTDLERRVAQSIRRFPGFDVVVASDLRGSESCPDVPCAARIASGASAGRLITVSRVQRAGKTRVSLSRLDGQRIKTIEVSEDDLDAGVEAALELQAPIWPLVGAGSILVGAAATVVGLAFAGVSIQADREALSALNGDTRTFHEGKADDARTVAFISLGVGITALVVGGLLVWTE